MTNLKDIMKTPVAVAVESCTLRNAALTMKKRGCGFLPVVRDGKPVGVITARDIASRMVGHWATLDEDPVSVAMSTPPICISETAEFEEAIVKMRLRGVHRLVVVDTLGNLSGV